MDAAVRFGVASHGCSVGQQVPARFPLLKFNSTAPGRPRVRTRHMVATLRQSQARRLVAMAQDSQGADAEEEQPRWLQNLLQAIALVEAGLAGVKADVAGVKVQLTPIQEGWPLVSGSVNRLVGKEFEHNVKQTPGIYLRELMAAPVLYSQKDLVLAANVAQASGVFTSDELRQLQELDAVFIGTVEFDWSERFPGRLRNVPRVYTSPILVMAATEISVTLDATDIERAAQRRDILQKLLPVTSGYRLMALVVGDKPQFTGDKDKELLALAERLNVFVIANAQLKWPRPEQDLST